MIRVTHISLAAVLNIAASALAQGTDRYEIPDYVAKWEQLVELRAGDAPDARPILERAGAICDGVERDVEIEFPGTVLDWTNLTEPWITQCSPAERAIAERGLELLEERGLFELLSSLEGARMSVLWDERPERLEEATMPFIEWSSLARRSVWICKARLYGAILRGDSVTTRACLDAIRALAVIVNEHPTMIAHLVGRALDGVGSDQIRAIASTGRMPGPVAEAVLDAWRGSPPLRATPTMWEAESLYMRSSLEHVFAPDGQGVGRLRVSALAEWSSLMDPLRGMQEALMGSGEFSAIEFMTSQLLLVTRERARTGTFDAMSPFFASRVQSMSVVSEFYELVSNRFEEQVSSRTLREDLDLFEASIAPNDPAARMAVALSTDMLPVNRAMEERVSAVRAGNTLLLAIIVHENRHGRSPGALDALVPGILDALPMDPHSGVRFRYRPATEDEQRFVRTGFVLYSVGGDGVDDGGSVGEPGEYSPWEALSDRAAGHDYIVNFVRPDGAGD